MGVCSRARAIHEVSNREREGELTADDFASNNDVK